jgi:hypothetical protein
VERPLEKPAARATEPEPEPVAAPTGLRRPLRLGPTSVDETVSAVFDSKPKREGDAWSWRDLLGGMDEERTTETPDAPDEDLLADRMIDEIGALGVDPNALLPRTRVEEAAAAYSRGEIEDAREVVRRIAPAAVRRVSRRILTDERLKAEAQQFLRRYEKHLIEASRRDPEGYAARTILSSDPGRAFLLVDAAVGDL